LKCARLATRRRFKLREDFNEALREFTLLRDLADAVDNDDRPHLVRYTDQIGDLLGEALFGASRAPSGTLVRILARDPTLLGLPWELARSDGSYVFRDKDVRLTRSIAEHAPRKQRL
jgi:hypothetical protein